MGTQQILLIVLSVIIVGIAVAVGIAMFNQQAVNSARNSIIADMNNFASQVAAYYRTPQSMGGASNTAANVVVTDLQEYLGWGGATMTNENGTYTLNASDASAQVYFTCAAAESGLSGDEPSLGIDCASDFDIQTSMSGGNPFGG